MKNKETLEEAVKREYNARKFNSDYPFNPQSFKLGAKWQQERMYSEDDMIMFADFFHNYKELLKKEKWEILEISKEDVFKKWKQI